MSKQKHKAALEDRLDSLDQAHALVDEADGLYSDETTSRLLTRIEDDIEKVQQITEDELSIYNAEWDQAAESAAKIRDAYFEIAEMLEDADIIYDLNDDRIEPEIDPDDMDGGMLDLIDALDTEIATWINVTETIEEECR